DRRLSLASFRQTRPPARTRWLGGRPARRPGDLDRAKRPHRHRKTDGAPSVLSHTREDTWDRGKSLLVFWVLTAFGSRRSRGMETGRLRECGLGLSDVASLAMNVAAVGDTRGVCAIPRSA